MSNQGMKVLHPSFAKEPNFARLFHFWRFFDFQILPEMPIFG